MKHIKTQRGFFVVVDRTRLLINVAEWSMPTSTERILRKTKEEKKKKEKKNCKYLSNSATPYKENGTKWDLIENENHSNV